MKKIFLLFAVFIANICTAQQKDTITVKEQKGLLFISEHNYRYDTSELESRPLGFHDFFFPAEHFDSLCIADSNKAISFKNGLRVDYIRNRQILKEQAMLFKGRDTSWCYEYNQFYVIPVIISYKQFEDYEPLVCHHNYFDIQVEQGAALHFEYQHQMIKPIGIKPLISKNKPSANLKKSIQKPKLRGSSNTQRLK